MAYQIKNSWSASEAKNSFGSLLHQAQNKEQVILRHGKPVGVVIGYEAFLAKSQNTVSIWDLLRDANMKQGVNSK